MEICLHRDGAGILILCPYRTLAIVRFRPDYVPNLHKGGFGEGNAVPFEYRMQEALVELLGKPGIGIIKSVPN